MTDINRLLKKKGWTGAELGRLEIANSALAYDKALKSNSITQEPIVSNADFRKMLATIKDPEEARIYNGYISIHQWINSTGQMAIAQDQQAQLCYHKLWMYIENAITAEDLYSYIEELPCIMTEKQYKETVEKRTQELLHEDGEDIEDNVLQLVFDAIEYYTKLLESNPKARNPLKPLKKKLEKELVHDHNILDRYNEVRGLGYYTLEDGTRSDRVSPTEWARLVSPTVFQAIDEDPEIGEKEAELLKDSILERRVLANAKLMFEEDLTEAEADKKRQEEETKKGLLKACQWHYYEDSPEGLLTKWEVLVQNNLMEYYPYYEDEVTDEEALEMCKAFVAEFPTVVKAILEDMGKKYPSFSKLKDLPVEEWLDTYASWEDLYKADFYGFKKMYVDDSSIFEGNRRAVFNGIAILRPSDLLNKSPRISPETGYYVAPNLRQSLLPISLEGFFPESEHYADNVDRIEDIRETLLQSLYFVQGYNKLLDLIATMFNIEEVKIFKRPLELYTNSVEALNNSIYMLYKRIKDTDYEDKELRDKKLEVLKDILYPVDLKKLAIPKKKITQAKKVMKDFVGFKDDTQDPYFQLCIYDPTAVKDEPVDWDAESEDEDGEGE